MNKDLSLKTAFIAATSGLVIALSPITTARDTGCSGGIFPVQVTAGSSNSPGLKPDPGNIETTADLNSILVAISSSTISANAVDQTLFNSLKQKWFNDPAVMYSSDAVKFMNSLAFNELVQLGRKVVPFIGADLSPDTIMHWDLALTQIYGTEPVPEKEFGKPDKMVTRWRKFLAKHC